MSESEKRQVEKDPKTGRFLTGNTGGPGRTKGSRNKLGEAFIQDMFEAWQTQGPQVIARVIEGKPEAFLKVVASLLPKHMSVTVDPLSEMTEAQLVARIRELDEQLGPVLAIGRAAQSGGKAGDATTLQ